MNYLWQTFLYEPVLNVLIWLYNNIAGQNLGIALIELTVALRLVLLPFTIVSMRATSRYDRLRAKIHDLEVAHKNDPVLRKESLRRLLTVHRISPWAKAMVLGAQFVVLIVLYGVFVTAVRTNDYTGLYFWNTPPDFLNTHFLGFNLSMRSLAWSGVIGIFLYIDLWISQRKVRDTLTNRDVFYRVAFPLTIFVLLYLLPTAKSVFVLTSMLFTVIIELIRWILFRPKNPPTIMGGIERIEQH